MAGACLLAPSGGRAADSTATGDTAPPRIDVVVVASHHHALRHWLRALRGGSEPAKAATVVHFDAHPDLALPPAALPAGREHDPGTLLREVDIASFQLAGAWLGLVRHVVWLRPSRARQIPDGPRSFRLGLDASGRLRVDDPADYWVLDGSWAPTGALRDAVPVSLDVVPFERAALEGVAAEAPVVLDVDLDAFATRNPAAERLRRAGLTDVEVVRLRTIFDPQRLALPADPRARSEHVEGITRALAVLASGSWWAVPGAAWRLVRAGIAPGDLLALSRMTARLSGDGALEDMLEDGRALVGLPEYPDTPAENVARTALALRDAVARSSWRPVLVTVARSVDDGYTPEARWPEIEWATLFALRSALGPGQVRYDLGLKPAPRISPDSPAIAPFLERRR